MWLGTMARRTGSRVGVSTSRAAVVQHSCQQHRDDRAILLSLLPTLDFNNTTVFLFADKYLDRLMELLDVRDREVRGRGEGRFPNPEHLDNNR